jgi:hypothetical protein
MQRFAHKSHSEKLLPTMPKGGAFHQEVVVVFESIIGFATLRYGAGCNFPFPEA